MQYLGGKSRIAKELTRVMLDYMPSRLSYKYRLTGLSYAEPFVGAGAVAAEMVPWFGRAYLNDASPDLIALWRALQDGWTPPETVSEDEYQAQRYAPVSALRGFVGYGCSFGGKWFGGYARDPQYSRNFARTAGNLLIKRIESIRSAEFYCQDYRDLTIPRDSVVYCDPPYQSMTKYARLLDFDSDEFWKKASEWSESSLVFVSEYSAPEGWCSVWDACPRVTLRVDSNSPRPTEHLWVKEH